MKHLIRVCRRWGWQAAIVGLLATGSTTACANDWGSWPVPWPPPGSTNPPVDQPPGVPPPIPVDQPPGTGSNPPPVELPPPGTGNPPPDVPPPDVPPPGNPPPGGAQSPEPASAVMGLCGL